ncbi:MAG TPA: acetate/propionate family kinase [Candidatus Eisenbacteria bacterium]|nr:acetate/propionate family kinase [Candidatus Eisenbacteria bacterium]
MGGRRALSLLTINAGSSTLKAALFDDGASREIASVVVEGTPDRAAASLEEALNHLAERAPGEVRGIRAIGHRVVHGGTSLRESIRIDPAALGAIRLASELAPLHNPPALLAIEAAERRFAGTPQVAAFDTAFFSSLEPPAFVYPLPYEWYRDWGIRRFGFHGLSHAYCSTRAAEMLDERDPGTPQPRRIIVLHLGNGCSASAVVGGRPVATTMGFTPLEGLMMGTRPGSVDPGILLHVLHERGLDPDALTDALLHRSGLLGVSGVSGDFREVSAAAAGGNERARLAIEIYSDRARSAVGSLAVRMGGVDALVFTAGVGENARDLRALVCTGLQFMGLNIDPGRNRHESPDADIATSESPARILILRTREDLMLARETRRVLGT